VKDALIDSCITDAVLSWEFARPYGGGWVLVDYPFVLTLP
jgi:hypothetical protein